MSMCRVFSCVVGRGCFLWPVCSLGRTLLVLPHFILYSKAKFACYSRCFLTSYFCIPVAQRLKRLPGMQETRGWSLGGKIPWRRKMGTHSSTLAWRIHARRSLVGSSPWGRKELDTTERLHSLIHTNIDKFVNYNIKQKKQFTKEHVLCDYIWTSKTRQELSRLTSQVNSYLGEERN